MRNCPDVFYNECANAIAKCRTCKAGEMSGRLGKLYYESLTGEHPVHPSQIDQNKRKRLKEAQTVEKNQRRAIADATLRSGAALGDGDTSLLGGELRLETKDRGVKRSWNLTLAEWEKGQRQRIDAYGITIEHPETGKKLTLYMMSEAMFGMFLAYVQRDKDRDGDKESSRDEG